MADSQTKVVISGDSSGAVKAIEETRKALSSASADMQSALSPLSSGLGQLKGAFASLGALLAGGALFKSSVSAANEWNGEVGKLAKSLGITTENASVMAVALNHLGISSDSVVAATFALSKQLKNNEGDFTALGIQTRNYSTGALLPAGEIMAAVNAQLAAQKNGMQQNIDGIKFYGKAWAEAKATLRLTTDQIEAAEKRARDLHLIVGPEGLALTKTYKEEQRDLAMVWKSMEIQLGTAVLPTLVKLGAFMSGEAPKSAKVFALAMEGIALGTASAWLGMQKLGNSLGAFAAQLAAVAKGNLQLARNIGEAWQDDDAAINKQFSNLVENFNKPVIAEDTAAKKRKQIQEQLQAKIADLDALRAKVAAGVSAEVLDDDDKRTKAQIANAEKLRDALRSAWQASLEGSKKATEEAKKLTEKAAGTRQTAADKITDIDRGKLPPEEQNAANLKEAQTAVESANENATLAKFASQYGRTKNATDLAEKTVKDLERATALTEKIQDPEAKKKLIKDAAEASAAADEAKAKTKKDEAAAQEETAASQAGELNKLDAQITELQNKAANISVQLQIDQAEAAIASLQSELAAIQDKTVTITVNTVTTGSGASLIGASSALPSGSGASAGGGGEFARGGYTGRGGKWQPAGIVHAGEFVLRSEVVNQPGAIALLSQLNAQGLSAIPGFSGGGLVSALSTPALASNDPAPARATSVFNFPDLGRYPVTMAPNVEASLQAAFARAALQKGGRR